MENRIKQIAQEFGAELCGIAAADRFAGAPEGFKPTDIYADCRSVVVFAKRLPKGLAYVSPRILYHHATDVNLAELDRIAMRLAIELETMGGIAVPVPSDSPYDFWDGPTLTGRGLLSMRHAAVLAGLGSLGKNTLLINKKYGNMLNIGAVLTDRTLASDPLSEDLCGKDCRRCIKACPQKALNGMTVDQSLCRPHTYGVNGRGFGIVNCNVCRLVCPKRFGAE